MKKTTINVGDVIYERKYGDLCKKHVIERVTKTQAVSKYRKFKRIYIGDNIVIKSIGNHRWDSPSFNFETPELKEEFRKVWCSSIIKKFDLKQLDVNQLNQIVEWIYKIKDGEQSRKD